jgi:hypothetical protein
VASGTARTSPWKESFRVHETITYFAPDGEQLVTVSPDRKMNPKGFIVTGGGVPGIGSVGKDLHLYVRDEPIGFLNPPWTPRFLRGRRPDFILCDMSGSELGRIKHRTRFLSWTVIEVDPAVTEPLRSMLFGVEALVHRLLTRRGGG